MYAMNIYLATYLAHLILSDLTNITTLGGNITQEALPPTAFSNLLPDNEIFSSISCS